MERFGPHTNFAVKVFQLRVGPLWPVGPVQPKLVVPFPKILVSSPTLLGTIKISVEKQMAASFRFILIIPLVYDRWPGWAKWEAPGDELKRNKEDKKSIYVQVNQ